MLTRIRTAAQEKEEGFTLIELLVVIIIIGILAAIAIPVFLNQRNKGYDSQAKSDARNIGTFEETYLTDHSTYFVAANNAGIVAAVPSFKASGSVTNAVEALKADGTKDAGGANAIGYCVTSTSASGTSFYYNSLTGGITTTACP